MALAAQARGMTSLAHGISHPSPIPIPILTIPRAWFVRTNLGRGVLVLARAPDADPWLAGSTLCLVVPALAPPRQSGPPPVRPRPWEADWAGDRPVLMEDEEVLAHPAGDCVYRRWTLGALRSRAREPVRTLIREEWCWVG